MENGNNGNAVRGFKVFNEDWTCSPGGNTKQYTCPGKFKENGDIEVCKNGMHFCEDIADCFDYYGFDSRNKVAEVIAYGKVVKEEDKSCTDKLEIVREIPWEEVLRIVNTGKYCTGNRNTGDCNSGNRNTGNRNTGDWNTGNWNTGDWNKASRSTGCFSTEAQKIKMFNKESDWNYGDWFESKARALLNRIPQKIVEWVPEEDMTEQEKTDNPECATAGGYLKVVDGAGCAQEWWDGLREHEKDAIRGLPNFDPEIFRECTGIDMGSKDAAGIEVVNADKLGCKMEQDSEKQAKEYARLYACDFCMGGKMHTCTRYSCQQPYQEAYEYAKKRFAGG